MGSVDCGTMNKKSSGDLGDKNSGNGSKRRRLDLAPSLEGQGSDGCESANRSRQNDINGAMSRAKTSRALPVGYICNACKQPGHAIYDCPLKVSRMQKEKEMTLFLSRLPKTWDKSKFIDFLAEAKIDLNTIVNTKMVLKVGEGTESFSGVVLLTVKGDESFSNVLQLNGGVVGGREIIVKLNEPKRGRKQEKRCARCGGTHDMATCGNPRVCYRCQGSDHISSECPRLAMKIHSTKKSKSV